MVLEARTGLASRTPDHETITNRTPRYFTEALGALRAPSSNAQRAMCRWPNLLCSTYLALLQPRG